MNSSHVTLRAVAVAAAAAVTLASPALAAPKKTKAEPAPAAARQITGDKTAVAKTAKNKAKVTKTTPAAAEETTPPQNTKTVKAAKTGKKAKAVPVPAPALAAAKEAPVKKGKKGAAVAAAAPSEAAAEPKKPGFFKRMFGRRARNGELVEQAAPGTQANTHLAKAKPVVPRALPAGEQPEKKRGFFSFLRRDKSPKPVEWDELENAVVPEESKMDRPADWEERSVVKLDGVDLYEFGPSQAQGPDTSLGLGTVVKVKQKMKGWVLVEVEGGPSGYVDASALRQAAKTDFKEPPVVVVQHTVASGISPEAWAPLAPPPDLPEQPGIPDANADALLLLPPLLELEEPKKTPPSQP